MITEFGLLKQPRLDPISRMELYSGEYAGCKISLITNGKCSNFGCDEVMNSFPPFLILEGGNCCCSGQHTHWHLTSLPRSLDQCGDCRRIP